MKNNLKNIRKEAGLTMRGLGDTTGITASYICDLERGSSIPTLKKAYLLANVLNKSVYDIWPDTTEIIEETVTIRRCVIK